MRATISGVTHKNNVVIKKDTTEILSQYIDSLETNVDKGKVKSLVDELYHEALSL